MKDYKIFEGLKGKNVLPPLTEREKEEIWNSLKGKLYQRKKKVFPFYRILALAAIIILFFGIGLLVNYKGEKESPLILSQGDSVPMIEHWEGSPELIYETQVQDVRVAFVVDSNIEW